MDRHRAAARTLLGVSRYYRRTARVVSTEKLRSVPATTLFVQGVFVQGGLTQLPLLRSANDRS
jgi:hypothetical protein